MVKNVESFYRPEWNWIGRSLENYKQMHPKAANARTLTEARRLAFGAKSKSYTCCRGGGGCSQCKGR